MALFDKIYGDQEIIKSYQKNNDEKEIIEDKEKSKIVRLLNTVISTLESNSFFLGKVYIYISDGNIKIKHKNELDSEPYGDGLGKDVIINYLKNIKNMVLDDSININRLKIKIHLNYDIKSSYIGKGRIL